jgi:rhomboid protease GluP
VSTLPLPYVPPEEPVGEEPFAAYLVRKLVAEQGFQVGTFPEASALAVASDVVLTYSDGMSPVIVCIVDREQDASRHFSMDTGALERIGEACLKYAGTVNMTKLPLGLQVIEVGRSPATEEDRQRLGRHRLGVFRKVHLHAMHVDTGSGTVWANTWRRSKVSAGDVRKLLARPRTVAEEVAEPPARKPVFASVLVAALVLGFVAEHLFGLGGEGQGPLGPSLKTLVALGGLNPGLVLEGGQWWRLLTAPLLHGDLFHLALNGLCLWFVVGAVEALVGRAWLGLLCFVSALGGGAVSLLFTADNVVSVGASGVLTGVLAALLALSWRVPPGAERMQMQLLSLQLLLPSLIPIATTRTGGGIDFAAHLGGALAGGAVGGMLLRVWPRKDAVPPAVRPVTAVAVLAALALVASVGLAAGNREDFLLEQALIPAKELPTTTGEGAKQAKELLERYPRDPRAHLFAAAGAMEAYDLPTAEQELRAAIAEREILERFFASSALSLVLHGELGRVLLEQGRHEEARAVVAPFCASSEGLPPDLVELGLCEK